MPMNDKQKDIITMIFGESEDSTNYNELTKLELIDVDLDNYSSDDMSDDDTSNGMPDGMHEGVQCAQQ